MMKHFRKVVWIILAVNILILIISTKSFHVDDMTLSAGDVYPFDKNWTLTREDGTVEPIEQLPYAVSCGSGEKILLENTLPKEFAGMTLNFMTTDKKLRVLVDDEVIYEFGMNDKKAFGRAPGSIENFVDIPFDFEQGHIVIEITSPYQSRMTLISNITVAKRDVAIIRLMENNLWNIMCSIIIILAGIVLILLAVIQRISGKSKTGLLYLSMFCFVSSIYFFVETKTLSLFYGNQTLYSNLAYMCLMMIPFFLLLYYERRLPEELRKSFQPLLVINFLNILFQMLMQYLNILDFSNMAVVSYSIIFVSLVVVLRSLFKYYIECQVCRFNLSTLALMIYGICGLVNLAGAYFRHAGNANLVGRLGTLAFCITMVIVHIREVSGDYAGSLRENARLLKQEVIHMEQKNAQLKIAKEEAEEAKLEAQRANEAKGMFLAHMSHEIRTPINAVLGMDEMILRESTEEPIREYAQDIYMAGQTLLALINDILDFSKIDSGKMEIVPVKYDLSSLLHDLINMVISKAQSKGLELKVEVDRTLPSWLIGDDVRIRQILLNVLNNAIKYTEKGIVTLKVSGRKEEQNVILHFEVIDTGIGIKEEDIPKIFQAFQRVDETHTRHIEGTGLGMSITTQLLNLMDSHLEVKSTYGEGSNFYFDLKQEVVDDTEIGDFTSRIRSTVSYEYNQKVYAPKANILVVDDNSMNRKVFISLLKSSGMKITEASGGKECLEKIQKQSFDLIFLDHMMPEMDGIETLQHMKELTDHKCKDTPVIALTANAITGAREFYLEKGFRDFLSKPIDTGKLEQMILKWLSPELLEERKADDMQSPETGQWEAEMPELPPIEGLDWNYAWIHLPEEDILMDTLCDFWKEIDEDADALDELLGQIDDKDGRMAYQIKVHGMKSLSALVGIFSLSGVAKTLEYASRDGKVDLIRVLHPEFIEEWRSYKERLAKLFKLDEMEFAEIRMLLDVLCESMEDEDTETSTETLEELKEHEYPFRFVMWIEQLEKAVVEKNVDLVKKIANKVANA